MRNPKVRLLTEIALAAAMAWVLNMPPLRFWTMPQGGELSLVMLPIILIALRHGVGAGITTGVLASVGVYLTEPFVVHPAQYLLDYPVAFGAVGLAGLGHFAWRKSETASEASGAVWRVALPAIAVGVVGRYVAHLVSGAVFFGEYAPEGQPVWVYSALYNLFVPISGLACFAAAVVLLPVLAKASPTSSAAADVG